MFYSYQSSHITPSTAKYEYFFFFFAVVSNLPWFICLTFQVPTVCVVQFQTFHSCLCTLAARHPFGRCSCHLPLLWRGQYFKEMSGPQFKSLWSRRGTCQAKLRISLPPIIFIIYLHEGWNQVYPGWNLTHLRFSWTFGSNLFYISRIVFDYSPSCSIPSQHNFPQSARLSHFPDWCLLHILLRAWISSLTLHFLSTK